jgi:hypothetical protein
MKIEALAPDEAAALLNRQQTLQAEAARVLEDLNLISILSRGGNPYLIGSCASGLMAWRDIDINVESPGIVIEEAWQTMSAVAAHPRIHRIRYLNDCGKFNPTGKSRDERYYFGVYYAPDTGDEWKIDVSFWLDDTPRSERTDLTHLQAHLTPERRLAILWLKDIWHRLPSYRKQVFSMDIYDAVLQHDVRTPAAFDRYLIECGKPGRVS